MVLRIEPRASWMLAKTLPAELQPQLGRCLRRRFHCPGAVIATKYRPIRDSVLLRSVDALGFGNEQKVRKSPPISESPMVYLCFDVLGVQS